MPRPHRGPVALLIALCALLSAGPGARAAPFSAIDYPGGQGSLPSDISADGKVVVGRIYDELVGDDPTGGVGFRWDDGAIRRLERCLGYPLSVSEDGAIVAGFCTAATPALDAAVWSETVGAYVTVPLAGDFEDSAITLVSGDGSVLFGLQYIELPDHPDINGQPRDSYQAFRSVGGAAQAIGRFPGDLRSEPVAASFDGAAAAIYSNLQGFNEEGEIDEFHGARFSAGPPVSLQNLTTSGEVIPLDISADGTTIVGDSSSFGGFRWRAETGMQALPLPTGALGVSPNGVGMQVRAEGNLLPDVDG